MNKHLIVAILGLVSFLLIFPSFPIMWKLYFFAISGLALCWIGTTLYFQDRKEAKNKRGSKPMPEEAKTFVENVV